MLKRSFYPFITILMLMGLMLVGCVSFPNSILILPKITLPQQDISLMGVTVSISGTDYRCDQALAKIVQYGRLVNLTASRDLRFLLQEVLEKQMIARGYMIDQNGTVNLQIVLNNLYANISQGNVRYNITTKSDISIVATAKNGNKMTKNYRVSHSITGIFRVSRKNISDAVNNVLSNIIAEMAQDTCIHNFIKQNARC